MLDFKAANVQTGVMPASKEEAIRLVAALLEKNGNVAPRYAESMLRRESLANTYLGQGIAIPHGVPADRAQIQKTGIAVLQVPQGVAWQTGDTARLIIGIAAKSDEHLELLARITELLAKPELADRLATTTNADEIVAALTAEQAGETAGAAELPAGTPRVEAVVGPAHGLHARPATTFAGKAREFKAEILVWSAGKIADGKSTASLLQLGAAHGARVTISADGEDADAALAALKVQMEEAELEEPVKKVERSHSWKPSHEENCLRGVGISPGLVIGRVHWLAEERYEVSAPTNSPVLEKRQLHQALEAAQAELEQLRQDVKSRGSQDAAHIFAAHAELLQDAAILARVDRRIDMVPSASYAWRDEMESLANQLAASDNAITASRAADVRDVTGRVLRRLAVIQQQQRTAGQLQSSEPAIWLAKELSPSQAAAMDPKAVAGFCTAEGSATSHFAILARSLGIPAVTGFEGEFFKLEEDELVVLDAVNGLLYRDPTAVDLAAAEQAREELADHEAQVQSRRFRPAVLTDGTRVEVVANIGKVSEIAQALDAGGEGVGLLRTEFLFLDRELPPSEEEQYETYRTMLEKLDGLPLVLRTLDIGGDKPVPYIQQAKEENPFLGVRGIRLCMQHQEIFRTQLRAAYRAAAHGDLKIMFPMIAAPQELRTARAFAEKIRREVGAAPVEIGTMIEVPAAVVMADELAREADFFSIGTNDLTQYVLAMDRGNAQLAKQAHGLHPAVLRMIERTVSAANKHRRWTGVCGGLAGEAGGAVVLAGLGVRELSVSIPAIPAIKDALRGWSLSQAEALAKRALACEDLESVRALLAQCGVQA